MAKVDSVPYFDTTDLNYRVLKAYYSNDSVDLKKIKEQTDYSLLTKKLFIPTDTCLRLTELKDLRADSAYRFIYDQAFSPYRTIITVGKYVDSARIHVLIFHASRDSIPCEIIDEFYQKLSYADWIKFDEIILYSDFWGSKEDNGYDGIDGTSLSAFGFIKGDGTYRRPGKSQYVYRWMPYRFPIYQPYNFITEIISSRYQRSQELISKHFKKNYLNN